jgi:hypothetical protein
MQDPEDTMSGLKCKSSSAMIPSHFFSEAPSLKEGKGFGLIRPCQFNKSSGLAKNSA